MGAPRVAFCDLREARAWWGPQVEEALVRAAASGRYILGPEVEAFEAEWASACGTTHAVGVGSGTAALSLILRALGIGPGDEVIVPAYTAPATWMSIAWIGARPVGVDVDPASGLVDVDRVPAAFGPRAKALVAVHLFGRLAPMPALRGLAERHGVPLIEDAAHAHGVEEGTGRAGSLGDAAAFSFYPTKALGALGDAGAVVTADADLAGAVRRLRSYGWEEWQGDSRGVGANSRLDEVQAAVLRAKLARLPMAQGRLREIGRRYREALTGAADLELPSELPDGEEPPWHQFVVRHPRRDALRDALGRRGVGTGVHYDPVPPQLGAFAGTGFFPNASGLAARALSLPCDPWLRDDQLDVVCDAVGASLAEAGGS